MKRYAIRTLYGTCLAVAFAAAVGGCGGGDDNSGRFIGVLPQTGGGTSNPNSTPESAGALKILSSRPDLVTGGDALVEIVPAEGTTTAQLKITLEGREVTPAFATRANGRFQGLVSGLTQGPNLLVVETKDGAKKSSISLVNRSNGSPVIYAPQVIPWKCDLGAVDAQCNRPVQYSFLYKSTDSAKTAFLPFDPANPAKDVATTKIESGETVPFVVRIENGVLDRDYYNIAVLFDPSKPWSTWAPQSSWNRKVVFTHGQGWGKGFGQLAPITANNVQNLYALGKGYAVMSTALNDTGHNGNLAVQAEAMMMLKERFIKSYGEIRYAIGTGGSGGALAQQWVANAYPGIYNGIIVTASFPDGGSTFVEIEDCSLLAKYFGDATKWAAGVSWAEKDQRAASGHLGNVCKDWLEPLNLGPTITYANAFNPSAQGLTTTPGLAPTVFAGCDAPAGLIFNAVTNPSGIRCTAQDYAVGLFGRQDATGFANRFYDNSGVQYGLAALKSGNLGVEQFIDLNSKIGSHDINYAFQTSRVSADIVGALAAYKSGYVNQTNGLKSIPIIDVRNPDITSKHHGIRSWVTRARLDQAQGHHMNHVIWYNAGKSMNEALDAMDAWLAAVESESSNKSLAEKVVTSRPSALTDLCGTANGAGMPATECTGANDLTTRMAAGAPLADNVLTCRLKPLDRADYGVSVTDAQWSSLQKTFPNGVCDYTQPGDERQPTLVWQTYAEVTGSPIYGGRQLTLAP